MKLEAIITVGVSASGKTHMINNYLGFIDPDGKSWVNLNRDDIRKDILVIDRPEFDPHVDNMWKFWKSSRHNEKRVTQIFENRLITALSDKKNIAISDTNLNEDRVDAMIERLTTAGYSVRIEVFHDEYATLVKRDALRKDSVGAIVIGQQLDRFYKTKFWEEGISQNRFKKPCILVDIDGTVAHMFNRTPFEWDRVDEDAFDYIVWGAVLGAKNSVDSGDGVDIIFVSGRDGICRSKTEEWLDRHLNGVKYQLLMRPIDNTESDYVIKKRMIEDIIQSNYIACVFDDRPVVARMYRSLGLKVFQLGNPFREF